MQPALMLNIGLYPRDPGLLHMKVFHSTLGFSNSLHATEVDEIRTKIVSLKRSLLPYKESTRRSN